MSRAPFWLTQEDRDARKHDKDLGEEQEKYKTKKELFAELKAKNVGLPPLLNKIKLQKLQEAF